MTARPNAPGMTGDGGDAHGFTLLEVLAAIVVFGILLVGLAQSLRFGLTAWHGQDRRIDARGDLDGVDRVARGLVARLDPRDPVDGHADSIAFTSVLPGLAGLDTPEADMMLLVDARRHLLLRHAPHRHAMPFAPLPPTRDEVLLDGVARLQVSYWPRDGATGWRNAWHDTAPPAMVRLRLVFAPGDPRHWPDIVAAPALDRPDGS